METIFGLIREYAQGDAAVRALLERGFEPDKVNVVLLESIARNAMEVGQNQIKVEKSAEFGEPGSHGLDGLLGGEQTVRVPDAGDVYAAGELANLITSAASVPGTVDGGLQAALVEFNLPPETADFFQDGVKAGGLLFFIRTEDEHISKAAAILREHKAEQVTTATG